MKMTCVVVVPESDQYWIKVVVRRPEEPDREVDRFGPYRNRKEAVAARVARFGS